MASLSHSESRRLYSWWWDSHNTPKNSKWLQENITDMDGRVKSMIKLIEEDADSFARKAEMYYKKRPELMKLVEEFYRAYRALAERYNHATGELRHAHRTIAAAFPDQVPIDHVEDSPSKLSAQDWEPGTPDPMLAVVDADENMGLSVSDLRLRRGPKTAKDGEEISEDALLQLSTENQTLKDKVLGETERARQAESEVHSLKKALADMDAEKEDIMQRYQQCLEKLPEIERELSNAQMDSVRLNEKASRAEIEVQTLKEALVQLESEKIAGVVKREEYSEKISNLVALASQLQDGMKAIDDRNFAAESRAQTLKDEVSTLELEKEAEVCRYHQRLEKISELESIVSNKEDAARMLKKQAERAESEVSELKNAFADLSREKEVSALQYKHCLETIAQLERDISSAKDEVVHLNNLVLIGTSKLKTAEERCNQLTTSNQALRDEADNLAKKIAIKNQELLDKQGELEKLQSCLQDENMRHAQVESTLETLQNLHTQSQDDQRALAVELRNMLQMLEDVQASKLGLEEELQKVRDENHSLGESSICSAVTMENMQSEVLSLREIRERLEKEVSHHMGIGISLQHEILCLKEEIERLNKSYQALVEQVEAAGLNPKFLGISIKSLQDENSKLKQMQEKDYKEKEILLKKLENIEEVLKKKLVAERSLSELNAELEMSHGKVKALQESCQLLHGEKSTLVAEKASLLLQLQTITENMNSLLGQNAVLDHSLSAAKVELEGLREKSKGLEEICNLLKNERSFLASERDTLVLKLENVERKLESLENKYSRLGEKYADLEKENEAMHFEVKKLEGSLGEEKQERIGLQLLSETRMAGLENEIHLLQEENKWKKKESEQELEKALKAQFEISILQKFIKDMESKNTSLIIECQKHVEASNLAEKVISELESESLEQQVETELLLDEIGRLRLGIYQIFTALESSPDCTPKDEVENEQNLVDLILGSVQDMKCAISKNEDEKQQLLVENSVMEVLLDQLQSKGMEFELQKADLDQEAKIMAEKLANVNDEKEELLEINMQLKLDATKGHQTAAALQAELGSLSVKQGDLQTAYNALQEAYCQAKQENASLLKKFSVLIEDKNRVDQHNDDCLLEFLVAANQSEVLKDFAIEKIMELRSLLEDLNRQREVNSCLGREMNELGCKLDLQKAENLVLKDSVCSLEREMQEMRQCNVQMKQDMTNSAESFIQTKAKLFDAEMHLEATERLNTTLFRTVAELRFDVQRSQQIRDDLERNMVQLSETNSTQMEEIQNLQKVNKNLESELDLLHQEIEENIVREQTLSIELQGMNNEFELWDAEAETFCFDLQVSSVQEVLLKNMVQELTGVCQTLEHKHAQKSSQFEEMKGKFCLMENEVNRLKSQVSAYAPVIASLTDDITLIEHNVLLHSKLKAARSRGTEFQEPAVPPTEATSQPPLEVESLLILQNLQKRVKFVGKLMEETIKPALRRRSNSKGKQEPVIGEVDLLKMQHKLGRDKQERSSKKANSSELNDSPRLQKMKSKASGVRKMLLLKDIPLDQASDGSMRKKDSAGSDDLMLELWETVEDGIIDQKIGESVVKSKGRVYDQDECMKGKSDLLPSTDSDMEKELGVDKLELSSRITEPDPELNDENILERLASDTKKLESLQTTLYDLRRKMETYKKSRKAKNIDFETMKEQLQEAEDTLVHLVDLNVQLVKNIEECPPDEMASPRLKEAVKTWRSKVMEQAQKGSERLDMLQLDVQKIQFVLSKVEDEGKNKGSNKFLRSRTVILRDFIYNGKRNSGKRKKGPNCGCFKQTTSFDRSRS